MIIAYYRLGSSQVIDMFRNVEEYKMNDVYVHFVTLNSGIFKETYLNDGITRLVYRFLIAEFGKPLKSGPYEVNAWKLKKFLEKHGVLDHVRKWIQYDRAKRLLDILDIPVVSEEVDFDE